MKKKSNRVDYKKRARELSDSVRRLHKENAELSSKIHHLEKTAQTWQNRLVVVDRERMALRNAARLGCLSMADVDRVDSRLRTVEKLLEESSRIMLELKPAESRAGDVGRGNREDLLDIITN